MIQKFDLQQVTAEIQRFREASRSSEEFYEQFLELLSTVTGGMGGVVWDPTVNPFLEICHYHSDDAQAIRLSCTQEEHMNLLLQTARTLNAQLAFPKKTAEDSSVLAPVIIAAPIQSKSGEVQSLVELFVPAGQETHEYQETVKLLLQLCPLGAQPEQRQPEQRQAVLAQSPESPEGQQRATATPQSMTRVQPPVDIDSFTDRIHDSLDWRKTAMHIANEGRRVLDCDRVSVIEYKRRKAKSIAVSGQPSVNRRSNTVRGLEKVAETLLRVGETFWYPTDEQLPPQINKALEAYLLESVAKTIAVVPLKDRRPITDDEQERKKEPDPKIIGGLIVEYLTESVDQITVEDNVHKVAIHSENALCNAYWHRHMFLFWLWNLLGKSKIVTTMRNLPIFLSVLGGITILILALIFIPADFNISSEGSLLPSDRDDVFARTNGMVKVVKVEHQQQVEKGTVLLELDSSDLRLRRQSIEAEMDEAQKIIEGNKVARANIDADQKVSLDLETTALQARLVGLQQQLDIIEEETEKLTVKAESSGTILTWNVKELLADRPVRQGELLFEIADLNGNWELELDLPDRRIGHVLAAQKELSEDLSVSFVLASDPSERFEGKIVEISKKTQVDPEKGQTIRIAVDIDAEDIEVLQTKTGVYGKIHCGRRSLGYVWFHDVFEFVQSKIIFPFF